MSALPLAASGPPRPRGILLHRQLFMVLRDEIARGVYDGSGVLPKEESLCERFEVSRITVRRALTDLAALGLVERRQGLGTFVRKGHPRAPSSPTLGFIDALRRIAIATDVQVLEVEHAVPMPDIAALLKVAPGARALRAVRMRSVDDVPVMLTEAWVPPALGRRVTAAALQKKPLYEVLMDRGVKFGRVVQEITAQVASPDVARLLRTEVGSPLVKLVRLMHDLTSTPVLHLSALMPPERNRIVMDIPGESVNTVHGGCIIHETASGPRTLDG